MDTATLTAERLEAGVPALRAQAARIAEHFRVNKASDLAAAPPTADIMAKVLQLLRQGHAEAELPQLAQAAAIDLELFPAVSPDASECARAREMHGWLSLSVAARVQKSNIHHRRVRGMWLVRRGLAKVARARGLSVEELANLSTLGEIEDHVHGAEQALRQRSPPQCFV